MTEKIKAEAEVLWKNNLVQFTRSRCMLNTASIAQIEQVNRILVHFSSNMHCRIFLSTHTRPGKHRCLPVILIQSIARTKSIRYACFRVFFIPLSIYIDSQKVEIV